jgi:NADPH:quinone reductase-like Zn-dependent oxidoreductase
VSPALSSSRPDLKPGTEVFSRLPEHCRGSVSEYALSTESATALKPKSVSHVEAASIPLVSLTTLQAFDAAAAHFEGGLKDKVIFIPGGLSGTGSIAIQMAKRVFGAGTVLTTLSKPKIAMVDELLGKDTVDQIIDYTTEDPIKVIPPGSVDFVYDTMGQGLACLPLMKKGGIIVSISGMPFGSDLKVKMPTMPVMIRWLLNAIGAVIQFRAQMYGVRYFYHFMQPSGKDLKRLSEWIDQGKIKPVVGRVALLDGLKDVREGCQHVFSGKGGVGKFVIEIDHPGV